MLKDQVDEFVKLLTAGQPLEAMDQFYADEINVFENRELARAGKRQCLEFERTQLEAQPTAPKFKLARRALNPNPLDPTGGDVFLEYTVRFFGKNGHAMRLEEVAVQQWERGKIVQERFYYDGVVDEGDD